MTTDGENQNGQENQNNDPSGTSPEGQTGSGDQQSQTTGQGPQAGQGQGAGQQTDPQTGGQTGFTHPRLQGRSPEEIQRLFATMEETVREQGSTISQLQRQGASQQQQQQDARNDRRDADLPGDEEFYDKPAEAVRRIVQRELQDTVAPLNETVRQLAQQTQSEQMDQRYRNRWQDWEQMKPYIEALASRKGLDMSVVLGDPGVTEVLYHAVKNLAREGHLGQGGPQMGQQPPQQQPPQGQQSSQQQQPQGRQPAQQPQGVPQHRPSSAPMPGQGQNNQSSGPTRELTESERRMAREYGMTDEQFIRWQEADSREVIGME